MENIAPPLAAALHMELEMENGNSFRESLRHLLQKEDTDDFRSLLREWHVRKSHAQPTQRLIQTQKSPYRRALLDLFERGWQGEPILEPLQALKTEIHAAADDELQHFVGTLPFRAMIPVLLLQFPAYLLLLLGPTLAELSARLGTL